MVHETGGYEMGVLGTCRPSVLLMNRFDHMSNLQACTEERTVWSHLQTKWHIIKRADTVVSNTLWLRRSICWLLIHEGQLGFHLHYSFWKRWRRMFSSLSRFRETMRERRRKNLTSMTSEFKMQSRWILLLWMQRHTLNKFKSQHSRENSTGLNIQAQLSEHIYLYQPFTLEPVGELNLLHKNNNSVWVKSGK